MVTINGVKGWLGIVIALLSLGWNIFQDMYDWITGQKNISFIQLAYSFYDTGDMAESGGTSPYFDFYFDHIGDGKGWTGSTTKQPQRLESWNMKANIDNYNNFCLPGFMVGFTDSVPFLSNKNYVVDVYIQREIFAQPRQVWQGDARACVWWGKSEWAMNYWNVDGAYFSSCPNPGLGSGEHNYAPYIKCLKQATREYCKWNGSSVVCFTWKSLMKRDLILDKPRIISIESEEEFKKRDYENDNKVYSFVNSYNDSDQILMKNITLDLNKSK